MFRILVLNLGSTSFKFKLYQMDREERALASGWVECIGGEGRYAMHAGEACVEGDCCCLTHLEALELCMSEMTRVGVTIDIAALDALGYKAVHGGTISGSHVVDDALLAEMERMVSFAPAHNPVYLAMMRSIRTKYPEVLQIACFETAFHSTIPLERAVYGVPLEWVEQYGVRRYGFHGSSHSYIAWKMGKERPLAQRVISAHLGGSSSLCAILNGKSVAASMGATPQSGLFHNNRVGDFDAFCLPVLAQKLGGLDNAMRTLSSKSGLLGLSGVSNDVRAVEAAAQGGNERAQLALDAFVDAIVGYIGMYTAYLGGLDALCFTGGIGLNDTGIRAAVIQKLGFLGAKLDERLNLSGYKGRISAADSKIEIWSLETNEELMVARGCVKVLNP
ncbi:MAG: acetate/propionate family kinase [Eubacteriales bacterium]|nr:acetate/propionate family kinase [Eubacteriales bacterium]